MRRSACTRQLLVELATPDVIDRKVVDDPDCRGDLNEAVVSAPQNPDRVESTTTVGVTPQVDDRPKPRR